MDGKTKKRQRQVNDLNAPAATAASPEVRTATDKPTIAGKKSPCYLTSAAS
jgi:hypothetical protein